jgi:hypothetical protein
MKEQHGSQRTYKVAIPVYSVCFLTTLLGVVLAIMQLASGGGSIDQSGFGFLFMVVGIAMTTIANEIIIPIVGRSKQNKK